MTKALKFNLLSCLFLLVFIVDANLSNAQAPDSSLTLKANYGSDIAEIKDIMQFEGIDYHQLQFHGLKLADKTYTIRVKEIWNGKAMVDTVVFDSKSIGIPQFAMVNDSVFTFRVIGKHTNDNQLKMSFNFPRFSIDREYQALETDDYSLRNLAIEQKVELDYGKPFYLFAYILPYEREDGGKSWCDVEKSGANVEQWGEEFGIRHYLLFEMVFE